MIPAGFHVDSKFLAFILDAAFRSLLLGCFLGAVLAAFRVRAVRAKLLAWRGLLLVAIAMPLLIWLSPAVPLPIPVPSFVRNAESPAVQAAQTTKSQTYATAPVLSLGDARLAPRRESLTVETNPPLPPAPMPGFCLPPAPFVVSWAFLAAALYLTVICIFFVRLLIGMYFGRRLRHGSQTIADADGLILLAAASRASRLRTLPRLAASEAVAVPVTLGILRPAILLPASWREWERDEFTAVLAHEASHVARRDSLVQLLALVHRAIFWFSPLSWWLNLHLADLAEQASDEAALVGGADRTRYARALAGFFADLEASPSRVWWHGVAMAKTGDGEKRVDRILAWSRSTPRRANKLLIAAAVAICLPAVALSVAAHASPYDPQDVAAPPSPAPPPPPQQIAPPEQIPVPAAGLVAVPTPPPSPQVTAPAPLAAAAAPNEPEVTIPVPPQPAQAQVPSATATPPAPAPPPPPMPIEKSVRAYSGYYGWGPYWPWGPQFAIVTRGSDHPIVSDSEEAAEHAQELRSKIPGDFIWFEHDGKSYIIQDRTIVSRARQIWAQRGDSAKLEQDLQAKEQELSKQMREQVQQRMQEIRVKIPDVSAELEKLQSEVKELNAQGATMQQLGDLQRQVGELQQALGEARWNSNMNEINRKAAELGRQMGDLGRQIGEIARRGVEQAQQASEQMRQLLDQAVASGKAKPE